MNRRDEDLNNGFKIYLSCVPLDKETSSTIGRFLSLGAELPLYEFSEFLEKANKKILKETSVAKLTIMTRSLRSTMNLIEENLKPSTKGNLKRRERRLKEAPTERVAQVAQVEQENSQRRKVEEAGRKTEEETAQQENSRLAESILKLSEKLNFRSSQTVKFEKFTNREDLLIDGKYMIVAAGEFSKNMKKYERGETSQRPTIKISNIMDEDENASVHELNIPIRQIESKLTRKVAERRGNQRVSGGQQREMQAPRQLGIVPAQRMDAIRDRHDFFQYNLQRERVNPIPSYSDIYNNRRRSFQFQTPVYTPPLPYRPFYEGRRREILLSPPRPEGRRHISPPGGNLGPNAIPIRDSGIMLF